MTMVQAFEDSLPPPIYEPREPASPRSSKSMSSLSRGGRDSDTGSDSESMDSNSYLNPSACDESLPTYTPALTKKGVLQVKPELTSPFIRAPRRNWRTAFVEVNNTQLKLTQSDFCGFGILKHTATYSLQFAEIGLASDYGKRPHCFRLRIESKQFVFDCRSRQEMLSWMVGLQMAISLALPLELRQLPEDSKRRRRRHSRRSHRSRGRSIESECQHPRAECRCNQHTHEENGRNSERDIPRTPPNSRQGSQSSNRRGSRPTIDVDEMNELKWEPQRRQSRFSEKDFPHLFMDTTWEGKNILYRGRWALIQNKQIVLVLEGVFS